MCKNKLSVSLFCALFSSVSLHAMEQQQSNAAKIITIDQDLLGQELRNPKYEDNYAFNYWNFSFRNGFKAIAVVNLADSIVDSRNTQSKDENPFASNGHNAKSHTAYWSTFCTKKWETISQNAVNKPEEVAEFLTLCGKPMVVAIQFQRQTEYYPKFLATVQKLAPQECIVQE